MKCHECKGENFEERTVELTTRFGEYSVVDRSVIRPVCTRCGEFSVPLDVVQSLELRAALIILTQAPRVTGEMLKFTRKSLGLNQAEFASRIGTTTDSVAQWESEGWPIERWAPLAALGLIWEGLMPPLEHIEMRKLQGGDAT